MKTKLVVPFLSKAVNISMILLMIITLTNTWSARVVQAAYDPTFSVRLTDNQVHGYEWNLEDTVTLTIDDPDNGVGDDFTDSETVVVADWDPEMTFVFFDLGGFALEPGQVVSMTDGTTTKTHIVRELAVTVVDPAADTVSGTAEPGSEVNVGHICNESVCAFRRVTANLSGQWMANFSEVGEDPDEQDLFNIIPGTSSEARQGDVDGDNTTVSWRVPNPYIQASSSSDWINAYDWPNGTMVTLTIDDPSNGIGVDKTSIATVGPAPWNPNENVAQFDLQGFDVQPGHLIEVTDGTTSRTMIPTNLAVTVLDVDADKIYGVGTPGLEVQVCVNAPDRCYSRYTTPDVIEAWAVDYTTPGPRDDEKDLVNLQPGSDGWAAQYDANGNQTWFDWRIPRPYIQTNTSNNWVQAFDWPNGAVVTLTIDDPSNGVGVDKTAIATVGPAPWNPNENVAQFDLQGFDVQPGQLIEVTDGTTSRTMIPTNLAVTVLDVDANTISGAGAPSLEVQVCVNAPDRCFPRYTTPDATEAWAVDYANPGPRDDEKDLVDLQPGSDGWAAQYDTNGNQTQIDWRITNPTIEANLTSNWAHAREWPTGTDLTLTIDDPSNGVGVDKTVTAVVGPASWNPDEILAEFDLEGFDLQPGFILEVTDGITTRTMTLTNLSITGFDLISDTISGAGAPGLEVQVCVNAPDRCYSRYATPDATEAWSVDYANPGPRDDENDLVDLQPGSDGWAAQRDPNGNQTWIDWRIANPTIEANLTGNWVHAYEWPTGTDLTLTIDDPSNGVGVDKTVTTTVGPAPWNPNEILADFDLEGFDVQPGFILEVTDGITTRTMTTANLDITGFDLDADTITGVATPNTEVQVCVNVPNACYPRHINSDGSGDWTADYANPGPRNDEQDLVNLQPGTNGWAAENDHNGNRTSVDWRIANPWLQANPVSEWVQAREWPAGTTLTLTIDDPNTGGDVDYTGTSVVGPAPWDSNDIVAHFDLAGFDLQTGHIVTVTDGTTTRTMTPTNLVVTALDMDLDTISGVGDPALEVQVCFNFPDGCYARYTTPDVTEAWSVDYAHPGSRDDEQDLADLRAGSSGWAAQNDGQGNRTWIDWWIPSPYISDIADQITNEDTSTAAIPFMVDDADVPLQDLVITAESSNTVLVPVANIIFGGSGANRTITIQPAPEQYGSATITVIVDNGSQTNSDTFDLTVNAVNDSPTVTLNNKTTSLPENTSTASAMMVADIVVTDDDLGTNTLELSGADAALFQIVGSELRLKAGTVLDYETKPVLNVTVEVNDAALSGTPDDSDTLTINITDVNEAPIITEGESVTVTMSQNGQLQQFSLTLHATDEDQNSTLTWKVLTLAQHGTATVSGTGTSKVISYTPTTDYYGNDSFVVEVSDGEGGVDTITVNVTITKINQIFLPIVVR